MDVEDHVRCMKMDRRISQVVKQLLCFGHCLLRALCLLACNCTECHEHSEVDSVGVVQDASNDTLDVLDVGIAEGGDASGGRGHWALLPNCLGWGAYGQC